MDPCITYETDISLRNVPSPSFTGFTYTLGDPTNSILTWTIQQIVDYGPTLPYSVNCDFEFKWYYKWYPFSVDGDFVTDVAKNVDSNNIFVKSDTDRTL